MKRGQEIARTRKFCVVPRSAEADVRAAERKMTITTVRLTPTNPGSDSCHFPDNEDQPMEVEVATDVADLAETCNKCTCHTVKLCLDASGRGTAFCSCPSPNACLCKHIHGVCLKLSGGDPRYGGLAAYGLRMDDFRLDSDPDDFDSEIDEVIDMEMRLGAAVQGSGASDDDEAVGPSAAAVAANPAALATILKCIKTTFAELTSASKDELDKLGDEVIFSIRDRQRNCDTKIKPPQRQGRPPPQSAAARPTSGPVQEATSDDVSRFYEAIGVGRPKSDKPHRTAIPNVAVLAARLAQPRNAAVTVAVSKKRRISATAITLAAPLAAAIAVPVAAATAPVAAAAAPVAAAAAASSWVSAPKAAARSHV